MSPFLSDDGFHRKITPEEIIQDPEGGHREAVSTVVRFPRITVSFMSLKSMWRSLRKCIRF